MRILLQRTGGFAGISKKAIVDTANLSSEETQQLSHLLETANFFNLPTVINAPSNQADRFQYILTVEENNQQHTVKVNEAALPGTLKQIIEWINARGN
ncbi:protealysin inhibitor emfourin [Pelatocladus sp. BLCC-F211]|uniref:protealysin inhibitor emfourin n=1 Tax=Pelatocladus sp. BLCC-F211 TaxID=3342752 RepID=UPI0035BB3B5B